MWNCFVSYVISISRSKQWTTGGIFQPQKSFPESYVICAHANTLVHIINLSGWLLTKLRLESFIHPFRWRWGIDRSCRRHRENLPRDRGRRKSWKSLHDHCHVIMWKASISEPIGKPPRYGKSFAWNVILRNTKDNLNIVFSLSARSRRIRDSLNYTRKLCIFLWGHFHIALFRSRSIRMRKHLARHAEKIAPKKERMAKHWMKTFKEVI